MTSTGGTYFEELEGNRYGVLAPDYPLPENPSGDSAPNGGGELDANSPETAERYGGDGELREDFTTREASPPPVLSDQQVPGELQQLLQDTGEWDALDAIYEQLHQVEAVLHRVRQTLRALTDAKIDALPGNSAARLLKRNRKSSDRDDVPPFLKSPAEDRPDPEPVPLRREVKKTKDPEFDFRPVVHREPGETPPPGPREATTIGPTVYVGHALCAGLPTTHTPPTEGLPNPTSTPLPGDLRSSVSARSGDLRRARADEPLLAGAAGSRPNGKPRKKPSTRSSRVLTDEVRNTVVHYLEAGLSIRQAAAFVGCHHTTIIKAMQRDRPFAERIERAGEIGRAMPLVRIIRASRRCWRAAAWLVRHQRPGAAWRPEVA